MHRYKKSYRRSASLVNPPYPYAARLSSHRHTYPWPTKEYPTGGLTGMFTNSPRFSKRGILYIHIPFCQARCGFCILHRTHKFDDELLQRYVDALIRELQHYSRFPYVRELEFETVYLGGGTPSVLTPGLLSGILEKIHDYFHLKFDVQITLEANPQSLTREKIISAQRQGVNRVSFGIQTFHTALRKQMNLIPSREDIVTCVDRIRECGIPDVNVDMLFNIPGQTPRMIKDDARMLFELNPSGFDLYEVMLRNTMPLFKQTYEHQDMVPLTMKEKLANFNLYLDLVREAGFVQRNLYAFDNPGFRNRYVTTAHDLRDDQVHIIAAGAGAFGFVDDYHYINIRPLDEYIERTGTRGITPGFIHKLTPAERMERFMIYSLESLFLDQKKFRNRFPGEMEDFYGEILYRFHRKRLIKKVPEGYKLTRKGQLWESTMAFEFFNPGQINRILDEGLSVLSHSKRQGTFPENQYELCLFIIFHPRLVIKNQTILQKVMKLVFLLNQYDRDFAGRIPALLLNHLRALSPFPFHGMFPRFTAPPGGSPVTL